MKHQIDHKVYIPYKRPLEREIEEIDLLLWARKPNIPQLSSKEIPYKPYKAPALHALLAAIIP